jgi:hypothetical protein
MEKHRARVFKKNRVLSKIFDPKREGVKREWRRLYNEELCYLDPHKILFVQ